MSPVSHLELHWMSTSAQYKVWDAKRIVRKGVVANGFTDLIEKARNKLNVSPSQNVRICLECDGTEVDDEEYFNHLPENTVFQVILDSENWTAPYPVTSSFDIRFDTADGPSDTNISNEIINLLSGIHSDLIKCISFSNSQLEAILRLDIDTLADYMKDNKRFASEFKECCKQILSKRKKQEEILHHLRTLNVIHRLSPYVCAGPTQSSPESENL
ncbi:DNA fragmentation factor subunit alpha-like [Octopus vulgaris]|uniref:DNAation factor subunit alpha-like n=1 Tax=Octopus vulgaris TaxID=6645 RepID=A0AA36F350_OCTVU|nr:DNA fragmentation factor subunit alpha-like [Octopus vulgaris]